MHRAGALRQRSHYQLHYSVSIRQKINQTHHHPVGSRTIKNNIFNGYGDRVTKVTDGDYRTMKAKANVNGEWGTNFVATQKRIDNPADVAVWTIIQASIIKAQISVVDNTGKRLKTENRMWLVMP